MVRHNWVFVLLLACSVPALPQDPANAPAENQPPPAQNQTNVQEPAPPPTTGGFKRREAPVAPGTNVYRVDPGTHLLLTAVNTVSTKQAAPGDRIYFETAFPIPVNNRIVIPQGSYVTGTILSTKRPGRIKGRGELQVRVDSLMLPNGVARSFVSTLGAPDGNSDQKVDREQNKIKSASSKAKDAAAIATGAITGAELGGIGSVVTGDPKWLGIGGGAGAGAALLGVLFTRGPDAVLERGSTMEIVLNQPIEFDASKLDFSNLPPRTNSPIVPPNSQTQQRRGFGFPRPGLWPL